MSEFANTLEEAQKRFEQYEAFDPYPTLDCSLLNSSDIARYIAKTGMIFPFVPEQLKPATYALTIGGPYVYWEPDGERKEGILEKGKYLMLKRDSILFVTLEPYIQLPQYIAARFNLKIHHIYKGLLLGTGPIVDPGFVGRLSMPLHNFTSNDYIIRGGETFIWMEFTKLSPHPKWRGESSKEEEKFFKVFPETNRNKLLADYIYESDQRSIQSSIPLSVGQSANSAKKAEESANSAKTASFVIAGINLALVLTAIYYFYNINTQTYSFYDRAKQEIEKQYYEQHKTDSIKIQNLQIQVDTLKKQIFRRQNER